jgi:aspartoacylase
LPAGLSVHLHCGSLDLPRDATGAPIAGVHPQRQGRDWQPLRPGEPLFWHANGDQERVPAELGGLWPVFINEAAYGEKHIALGLTRRERWTCKPEWSEALRACLQRSGPL